MLKIIDHNKNLAISLFFVVCITASFFGCQAKTVSPISHEKVTAPVLADEYQTWLDNEKLKIDDMNRKYATSIKDLEQKQQMIEKVFTAANQLVGSIIPPAYGGLATIGFSIIALGLGLDNQRKDGVIAGQKMNKE